MSEVPDGGPAAVARVAPEPMAQEPAAQEPAATSHDPTGSTSLLALGAAGVVFGDIGTSPLYAMKEIFVGPHPLLVDQLHLLGALSLVFWSLFLIVTVKYVGFILRADNEGEGGSLALLALIQREGGGPRMARWLTLLGVAATALFLGDAMITPAVSVLSAVEGLETVSPSLIPFVIPASIAILIGKSWPLRTVVLNERSSVFDVVTIRPAEPSLRLTTARSILILSSAPKPSRTISSLPAAAIWPRPTKLPSR